MTKLIFDAAQLINLSVYLLTTLAVLVALYTAIKSDVRSLKEGHDSFRTSTEAKLKEISIEIQNIENRTVSQHEWSQYKMDREARLNTIERDFTDMAREIRGLRDRQHELAGGLMNFGLKLALKKANNEEET